MTIYYPDGLPRGLHSGRTYQLVSPLMRSELNSGRARQRRRFTNVPESATISWIFSDAQCQLFKVWFRYQLVDGSEWFECPLDTPEGYALYTARFMGVYEGPSRVGPDLWSVSADLELQERSILDQDWTLLPDYVLHKEIFDFAMNREWPIFTPSAFLTEDGVSLATEDGKVLVMEY